MKARIHRNFPFSLGALLFLALPQSAPSARAAATSIPPTPFAGRVARIVVGPSGRPDGLVLDDKTLLEFPATSLSSTSLILVGDQVSGTGIQVLSAPNRVFDRVALRRGEQQLFDNSKMQYPPAPPLPGKGVAPLKSMVASAPLVAVGATPDGVIDRLILANGKGANTSYIQVPKGAYVNPKTVFLGQPVAVQGGGTQFASGDLFIHAFTAQTVGGPWLFRARGYDGEQWMLKIGSIKQALVTPTGQVDGVLLTDNTAIRFAPIPGGQATELQPGVLVKSAGPGVANRMSTDSMLLVRQNRFVSLPSPYQRAEALKEMAGELPPRPLVPMKDRARVEAVFRNDRGEIDTLVLSDRTRVWIPPRLRTSLPRGLVPGRTVQVLGRGGNYAMGTGVEADQVKVARRG